MPLATAPSSSKLLTATAVGLWTPPIFWEPAYLVQNAKPRAMNQSENARACSSMNSSSTSAGFSGLRQRHTAQDIWSTSGNTPSEFLPGHHQKERFFISHAELCCAQCHTYESGGEVCSDCGEGGSSELSKLSGGSKADQIVQLASMCIRFAHGCASSIV